MFKRGCDRCQVKEREIRAGDRVVCVDCYLALKDRAARKEDAWLGQRRVDLAAV